MPRYNAPFEIHVHGDVPLRSDVSFEQIQEALAPLWKYAGAKSLADGATSVYEEEPGIRFEQKEHMLQICWTVAGDEDFRQALDEMCMALNELSEQGAALEVTFYDTDFDEEEGDPDEESRDDFLMLFVGPNPAAIMQVQRDLLVEDVVNLMERHFDGAELGGVVAEIDKLFGERFDALVNSLEIGRQRRPRRRPPSAPPALAARGHGPATPVRYALRPSFRGVHAWPCFPSPPSSPACASARCSDGRCTTSPIRATPRWSSPPCLPPISSAASPRARPGPRSPGPWRSASPTRS
jgi:hypothetical protein